MQIIPHERRNEITGRAIYLRSDLIADQPEYIDAEEGTIAARKREWSDAFDNEDVGDDHVCLLDHTYQSIIMGAATERLRSVLVPQPKYPKSIYSGHEPLALLAEESDAIDAVLSSTDLDQDSPEDSFNEAYLEDFCVYRAYRQQRGRVSNSVGEGSTSNEFASLNDLNECSVDHFCFDGLLCSESRTYYVERVPFRLLSIGGYEDLTRSSIGSETWIQSAKGKRRGIWYRLGRPAPEYERYHHYFRWTADLAKHTIDYIHTKSYVRLSDFQQKFHQWLLERYPDDATLSAWLSAYAGTDFRRAINRQANFLYSQALQLGKRYYKCPLWADVHPRDLTCIPEQVEQQNMQPLAYLGASFESSSNRRKTTVTPYVFRCFEHLPWASLLYPQAPAGMPSKLIGQMQSAVIPAVQAAGIAPKIGDVIAIAPDQISRWKNLDTEWLALVQGIDQTPHGAKMSVLWIYRHRDTACMKMKYPLTQEVFLSDHCNCGDSPLYVDEIIRKPSVAFFGEPGCGEEFFCRQQYREAEAAWTTLDPRHLQCTCKAGKTRTHYTKGQTVLYKERGTLRPAIVIEGEAEKGDQLSIRRFLYRSRDLGHDNVAPNELVLTDKTISINIKRVARRCSIRSLLSQDEQIHVPYNRGGVGDYFFVRYRQTEEGTIESLDKSAPEQFFQGLQSLDCPDKSPMRGLDLFCGGGNFARGMEEAGALKCQWAVDYFNEAIHTYQANAPAGSKTKMFRGSVNHFLSEAVRGASQDGFIPRKGEVDVILAGSPCQGFSMANPKKGNIPGLLNESLVASVVSFIDFYRPKYAYLENVKGMAMGAEDRNVLAAVLCAIVSMGYQVQTHLLDAWCFGCPQSRTRVFISCTAPGLPVPSEPSPSHGHPSWIRSGSLGRTANGLQTSARHQVVAPFSFVSAEEATKDLPPCDHTLGSIRYPDHREARNLTVLNRVRIASIPRFPAGVGFVYACAREVMPSPQMEHFSWQNQTRAGKTSRVWTRIKKDKLFPTIQTAPRPDDGHSGNILHWEEHRLLTILEARRAQGFLDEDVILGSAADQWKIVGNSVARPVAFALGLALREAWLSLPSVPESQPQCVTSNDSYESITAHGTASDDLDISETPPFEDDVGEQWQSHAQRVIKSISNVFAIKSPPFIDEDGHLESLTSQV